VAKALRYKLFGIGKMPPALAEAAARDEVLVAAEGVSIKQTIHALKMKRASVRHGVQLLVGSLVMLPDELLLSVGNLVIVNAEWRDTVPGGQQLTLAEDGVRLTCDVASLVDDGSGSVEAHFRLALTPSLLAQLPANTSVPVFNFGPALLNRWKSDWSR
jgi:hypothetical protein